MTTKYMIKFKPLQCVKPSGLNNYSICMPNLVIKYTSNKYRKAHLVPPSTMISVGIVVIKLRLRTCVPNQLLNIYRICRLNVTGKKRIGVQQWDVCQKPRA